MKNAPPKTPPLSIPLPDTLAEALQKVPRYVSVGRYAYGKKGVAEFFPEELEFFTGRHAFFMGKLILPGIPARIRRLLGWGAAPDPIYSVSYIEAMLDVIFENLKKGQKGRIVLVRAATELINGPGSVAGALSFEDQKRLILDIAKHKFKQDPESLEVLNLEEIPHHQALFRELRANVDPSTGQPDLDAVLLREAPSPDGELNSLNIARMLYRAAKGSDWLMARFRKSIPVAMKAENTDPRAVFYALVEVAVKLADLAYGVTIQCGPEREDMYDEIVDAILKGPKNENSPLTELKSLSEKLDGITLKAAYINTPRNPYKIRRQRGVARTRLGLTLALIGAATGSVFEAGRHFEKKRQEAIEQKVDTILDEKLGDLEFRFEGRFPLGRDKTLSIFKRLTGRFMEELEARFNIPKYIQQKFRPAIQDFMLKHLNNLDYDSSNEDRLIELVHWFAAESSLLMANNGITITRPYAHLAPYLENDAGLLAPSDNIHFMEYDHQTVSERPLPKGGLKHLGRFVGRHQCKGWINTDLYLYKGPDGSQRLVAVENSWIDRVEWKWYQRKPEKIYSSDAAREVVEAYTFNQKLFSLAPMVEYINQIYDLENDANFEKIKDYSIEAVYIHKQRIKNIADPYGEFSFEVALVDRGEEGKALVARNPGEAFFTARRAREAAKIFNELRPSWLTSPGSCAK